MELAELEFPRLRQSAGKVKALLRGLFSPCMSPRIYAMDFVFYPLLIAVCFYASMAGGNTMQRVQSMTLVLLGYGFWTLIEYLAHRFVLHHVPFFVAAHKLHHDTPRALVGTPLVLSFSLFFCIAFWPVAFLYGYGSAAAWSAGLMSGYIIYSAVHHALHHPGHDRFSLVRHLKRQHAVHHHRDGESNFGVTTRFWDRLFGTLSDG